MPPKRLTELDSLRGLAALSVVLFHYVFVYAELFGHKEAFAMNWAYWGQFGVHLFFMISGFVIFWTLQRCQHPLDFVVSRFSRLYPVYWAAAATTFLVILLFGFPRREVDALSALGNLTMIQEYLGISHIDGVYWTLTVELTFYLLMFLLFVSRQLKHIELWLVGLIGLAAIHHTKVVVFPPLVVKLLLLQYINLFAAGVCYFKIWNKEASLATWGVLAISFVVNMIFYPGREFLVFVAHFAVFTLLACRGLPFLRWKPLIFLGTISYALYLVHQNIGYIVIRELSKAGIPSVPAILIAIALAIGLATALTLLVEGPARKAIRSAYRRRRSAEPKPPFQPSPAPLNEPPEALERSSSA